MVSETLDFALNKSRILAGDRGRRKTLPIIDDFAYLDDWNGSNVTEKLQRALAELQSNNGVRLLMPPKAPGLTFNIEDTVIIPGNTLLDGVQPSDYWGDPSEFSGASTTFKAVGAGNPQRWYDEDGVTDRTDYRAMFVLGGRGAGVISCGFDTESGNPWDCAVFNPGMRQITVANNRDRGRWDDAAFRIDGTWSASNTVLTSLHPEIQADPGSVTECLIGKNIWRGRRSIKIQGARRNPADYGGIGQDPWIWGGNGISDTHFEWQMLRPIDELGVDYDDPTTWNYGLWIDYAVDNAAQAAQGLVFDYLAVRISNGEGMFYFDHINRLNIRDGYSEANTNTNPASGSVFRRVDMSVNSTKVEIHGDFGSNTIWYNEAGTGNALDAVNTNVPLDGGNAGIAGLTVQTPDGTRHVGNMSYGAGIGTRIDGGAGIGSSSRNLSIVRTKYVRSDNEPILIRGFGQVRLSAADASFEFIIFNHKIEAYVPLTAFGGLTLPSPAPEAAGGEGVNAAWVREYVTTSSDIINSAVETSVTASLTAVEPLRDESEGFRNEAESFRDEAAVSAGLAQVLAPVHKTEAIGLAATAPGDEFYSRPAGSDTTFSEYRENIDGVTSELIDEVPNKKAYALLEAVAAGEPVLDKNFSTILQFGGITLAGWTPLGRFVPGPHSLDAKGNLIEWRGTAISNGPTVDIYVTAKGLGYILMTPEAGNFGFVNVTGPVLSYYDFSTGVANLIEQPLSLTTIPLISDVYKKVTVILTYGQSLDQGTKADQVTFGPLGAGRIFTYSGARGISLNFGTKTVKTYAQIGVLENAELDTMVGLEVPAAQLAMCFVDNASADTAVVVAACGQGGRYYHELKKGTPLFANMMLMLSKAAHEIGLTGRQVDVAPVLFTQGEQDRLALVGVYKGNMVELQKDISEGVARANRQLNTVLVLSQMSSWSAPGYGLHESNVPLEQLTAALENPGRIECMGPKYPHNYDDGIHFLDGEDSANYAFRAERVIRQIIEATWTGPLYALTAEPDEENITLTFNIPADGGDIELSTELVSNPGNYGFRCIDAAGENVPIVSVTVISADQVLIVLSRPWEPGDVIGIADWVETVPAPAGPTTGPRCCLRSVVAGVDNFGNVADHYACHQRITILEPEEELV